MDRENLPMEILSGDIDALVQSYGIKFNFNFMLQW